MAMLADSGLTNGASLAAIIAAAIALITFFLDSHRQVEHPSAWRTGGVTRQHGATAISRDACWGDGSRVGHRVLSACRDPSGLSVATDAAEK
jgi:hypothetical protein